MEKMAHMEKKYEKVKGAYVRQSKMSASVNQALVSSGQQFQAHSAMQLVQLVPDQFRFFFPVFLQLAYEEQNAAFSDVSSITSEEPTRWPRKLDDGDGTLPHPPPSRPTWDATNVST